MSTVLLNEFRELLDREWARIAAPGSWWTGAERVAVAAEARAARAGCEPGDVLSTAATEAARRIAIDAAGIRSADVRRWAEDGLEGFAYVELVGLVSRLVAMDVASFGLGLDPRPLPDPLPGQPSAIKPDGAEVTTGWVPTIGDASAPNCMSAVPPEVEAMFDVHAVLYLSLEDMADLNITRDGVHRAQMELGAGRTSWLNECFY